MPGAVRVCSTSLEASVTSLAFLASSADSTHPNPHTSSLKTSPSLARSHRAPSRKPDGFPTIHASPSYWLISSMSVFV
ncbi:hypothetical protein BaRGS_00023117 [Batillaria attramentaria]|uniref:Secreted protein n=1 Tax=Batillaria attramentaria TaxID=370345 RepID=A0ABD0KEY6_9CAEN